MSWSIICNTGLYMVWYEVLLSQNNFFILLFGIKKNTIQVMPFRKGRGLPLTSEICDKKYTVYSALDIDQIFKKHFIGLFTLCHYFVWIPYGWPHQYQNFQTFIWHVWKNIIHFICVFNVWTADYNLLVKILYLCRNKCSNWQMKYLKYTRDISISW